MILLSGNTVSFHVVLFWTEDDLLPDFLSSDKSDCNHTTIHKEDNTV